MKHFYAGRYGRLVRRLVLMRIRRMWPDLKGLRLLGCGYATPYLRGLMDGTERTFALMSPAGGVHGWPEREKGLVALAAENEMPVETESVDRLLLIHSIEHAAVPQDLLQEAWRVLKSNGRLILVVPNRLGLWARADWTPFGHGRPYNAGQINDYLRASLFVPERTEQALFMPPFHSFLALRAAYTVESVGRAVFPGLAGVHMVEASKQIYGGVGRVRAERVPIRRHILVGDPQPAG